MLHGPFRAYLHISPLARGRGLKRIIIQRINQNLLSPLARGRGLKQSFLQRSELLEGIAPRSGAWIETHDRFLSGVLVGDRPSLGGVD